MVVPYAFFKEKAGAGGGKTSLEPCERHRIPEPAHVYEKQNLIELVLNLFCAE